MSEIRKRRYAAAKVMKKKLNGKHIKIKQCPDGSWWQLHATKGWKRIGSDKAPPASSILIGLRE